MAESSDVDVFNKMFHVHPGHRPDGGEAVGVHPLLLSGERPTAGRRRPQLHPPPGGRAGPGLPDQVPRRPHHLRLLLRAAGEPGEAAARREFDTEELLKEGEAHPA